MSVKDIIFIPYRPEFGLEVVKMWRRSFQKAMSLQEHNRFDEVDKQLDYFAKIDPARITVAIDTSTSVIAGFMALSKPVLDHLYVHVEYQGKGVGSQFLDRAKAASPHGLELFTFQKNQKAHSFYVSRGFQEVQRGYADVQDNPWATSKDDLADIKYRWVP